ncbi:hypothetical protein AOA80_08075 [Methanomassiliicoccales archaeon RumEn M1]|nr:hypothetical protein AOA80_08075 [Methanomassiliicoccales archaeon RumEn M1]
MDMNHVEILLQQDREGVRHGIHGPQHVVRPEDPKMQVLGQLHLGEVAYAGGEHMYLMAQSSQSDCQLVSVDP